MNKTVPKDFYLREDTLAVARDLIGKLLVVPAGRKRVSAMIVETEAYLGEIDKAAHSFGGRRTQRTEVMYAVGGTVYVFFVYGMYYQLNVVTGPKDHPHAILIRAAEPVEGIDIIRERRGKMPDRDLTSGPGKLCIALGIDKSFNGENFRGRRIRLEDFREFADAEIITGPRVGIDYAEEFAEMPWRFRLKDNPFVSGTRKTAKTGKR